MDEDLNRQAKGQVRLGHTVEMGFLLSRAVDAGLSKKLLGPAQTTVAAVVKIADRNDSGFIGGHLDREDRGGGPPFADWEQLELMRALAHHGYWRGIRTYRARFRDLFEAFNATFADKQHGGWYALAGKRDTPKGNNWRVDYHQTMFFMEMLRLQAEAYTSGKRPLL